VKVTKIRVGFGTTVKTAEYENARFDVGLTVVPDPGETTQEAFDAAFALCVAQVNKQEAEQLDG